VVTIFMDQDMFNKEIAEDFNSFITADGSEAPVTAVPATIQLAPA